ncbi:MAG: hypothetical protein K8H85_18380 [Cyclobacteriaceae bacterium]|nr:hypothetical protein [Cyclobacteriaceae bacterium]
MKKISHYLTALLLTILLVPAQLFAAPTLSGTAIPVAPTNESAKIEAMVTRLNEIKDMDKSDLSASERKALRKEVRAIKESVKSSGGGVYISVGAIIIIILLLIILL